MTADTKSAVLAELEAAAKAVCWRCRYGWPMAEDRDDYYHYKDERSFYCPATPIHRRIAALAAAEEVK